MVMRPSIWMALFLPVLVSAGSLFFQPARGCQTSCGGVDIPFPFGIGDGCFLPGFKIDCIDGSTPTLSASIYNIKVLNLTVMPRPEAVVMLPVAFQCYDTTTGNALEGEWGRNGGVEISSMYRISSKRNELVVLGCNTFAYTTSGPWNRGLYSFNSGCVTYCDNEKSATDGNCLGIGCCRVDIPPGFTGNSMTFFGAAELASSSWSHEGMDFSPCDYAFMVEKGKYDFRVSDLHMDGAATTKPLVLDWAIRDTDGGSSAKTMTCPEVVNKPGYACVSDKSECHNSPNGPGYFCNCTPPFPEQHGVEQ